MRKKSSKFCWLTLSSEKFIRDDGSYSARRDNGIRVS